MFIGDIIRYGTGSTALMKLSNISNKRCYGTQFFGDVIGRAMSECSLATKEDITKWNTKRDEDMTEDQCFILEHALNIGAEIIDDEATIYQMTTVQIVKLVEDRTRGFNVELVKQIERQQAMIKRLQEGA